MRADGNLEEEPGERHFVAHGLEEEVLEDLAGVEVVVGAHRRHAGQEARIITDVGHALTIQLVALASGLPHQTCCAD